MRTSIWTVLRAIPSRTYPHPCRFIAGRRLPFPQCPFHTSPNPRQEQDPPDAPWNNSAEQPNDGSSSEQTSFVQEVSAEDPNGASDDLPKPKDRSNYGSASRRAVRNVKPREKLPPVYIPPWFLDRNVVLRGYPHKRDGLSSDYVLQQSLEKIDAKATSSVNGASESKEVDSSQGEKITAHFSKGHLFESNRREISALVSAGLQVPSWQRAEVSASPKPHILLFCPINGTSSFLTEVGLDLAEEHSTDFVRLSPQDIAEIGGDYMDDSSTFRLDTLSSLGYDAELATTMRSAQGSEEPPKEEDFDELEGLEEDEMDQGRGNPKEMAVQGRVGGINEIRIEAFTASSLQDLLMSFTSRSASLQQPRGAGTKPVVAVVKDRTPESKMAMLVETLLNAPEIKRVAEESAVDSSNTQEQQEMAVAPGDVSPKSPDESSESPFRDAKRGSEGLIVLIQDYPQISMTANGGKFLDKLHEVVEARRREGQRVLIIGTGSSKSSTPSFSRAGVDDVQGNPRNSRMRTIVTPILMFPTHYKAPTQQKKETKSVNIRHLQDMLRRTAPVPAQVESVISSRSIDVDRRTTFLCDLEDSVWSFNRVNRAATIALGLLERSEKMTVRHIEQALNTIELSDNAKVRWHAVQEKYSADKRKESTGSSSESDNRERMRRLRKTCNTHEKKLLNGVVDPENIKTTFDDVHVPPQTKMALKTLTSLSLVRPDAFSYGVLATDRIPGLLLYGPPGTGKTLLAKAVAKDSKATVLEVSGSDIYDMYVGESEKNVRAIFTLAKKLTPCVVFIDEADAILGARGSALSRNSHRETINQFLREWDGMTELSTFIMVATNRPFDVDEAALRRLPRRLLVDLPTEKDREAILKIHLKSEVLDPEVSIPDLAAQTPFYSGSDLKNVCVAAALACVREELMTFPPRADKDDGNRNTDATTDEQKKLLGYPEKRTLCKKHFDSAMEEISASISEDMGSLTAIRKFDEKYGDRRGRRKKAGFGYRTAGAEEEKVGSDAARVRNRN